MHAERSDVLESGDYQELGDVRGRYEASDAYSRTDAWHEFTAARIRSVLAQRWRDLRIAPDALVLNAGAGRDDLGLSPKYSIHLDISMSSVGNYENAVLSSVEDIPLLAQSVEVAICIGSVINYCDAGVAIHELSRVLKPGGILFVEFESSGSAEYLGSIAFGKSAAIAKTFYADAHETLWVYSLRYIMSLLASANLCTLDVEPIHVVSPWLLRLGISPLGAARFAGLDRQCRQSRLLRSWASNFVVVCRKAI